MSTRLYSLCFMAAMLCGLLLTMALVDKQAAADQAYYDARKYRGMATDRARLMTELRVAEQERDRAQQNATAEQASRLRTEAELSACRGQRRWRRR